MHITTLLAQFYYANTVTKLFLNLSRFLSKKLDFLFIFVEVKKAI